MGVIVASGVLALGVLVLIFVLALARRGRLAIGVGWLGQESPRPRVDPARCLEPVVTLELPDGPGRPPAEHVVLFKLVIAVLDADLVVIEQLLQVFDPFAVGVPGQRRFVSHMRILRDDGG